MHIDPSWNTVVAALGASLLTTLGGFGLLQWQRRRDDQASTKASKLAAYSELHARTFSFARRADAFGLAKRLRSGIGESLDISLRLKKPPDLFELYEWLDGDFRQLSDAQSKICAIGSQEAIDVANRLIAVCGELIDTATATDDQRGRVVRFIRGEMQTTEQVQSYQDATCRLFKEREVLANLMRKEIGHEPAVFPIHRAESEAQGKNDASNDAVCADEEVASMLTTERRTSINRD